MGKMIDAAIGQVETAESLDRPRYALGKAISRTGQVGGRPSKMLANALHGRPLWPSGASDRRDDPDWDLDPGVRP